MWTSIDPTYDEKVVSQKNNDCILQILRNTNNSSTNKDDKKKKDIYRARASLDDSVIVVQAEDISYIKGEIAPIRYRDVRALKNIRELFNINKYRLNPYSRMVLKGSGTIEFKEASTPLVMVELIDEEIVIWDELLYCLEGDITVKEFTEDVNLMTTEYIEEKDMLKLQGNGLVILKLPVENINKIIKTKIYKNKIISCNNYVVLRYGNIALKSEYFGDDKITSYTGIGELWQIAKEDLRQEQIVEKVTENDTEEQ